MLLQKFLKIELSHNYSKTFLSALILNSQLEIGKTMGQNKGAINRIIHEIA